MLNASFPWSGKSNLSVPSFAIIEDMESNCCRLDHEGYPVCRVSQYAQETGFLAMNLNEYQTFAR